MDRMLAEMSGADAGRMAMEWLRGGVDFVQKQAPGLVREMLLARALDHVIWICISVFILVGCVLWFRWDGRKKWDDDDFPLIMGNILGFFGVPFALLVLLGNVYWLVVLWLAPHYYAMLCLLEMVGGK